MIAILMLRSVTLRWSADGPTLAARELLPCSMVLLGPPSANIKLLVLECQPGGRAE